ncbi:MAG: hypothetical protein LBU27_04635 [Candidatus Peribacteria bacterium]|nr:hypothetical protein [Candidatus Peribacteria bacterium]
MVAYPPDKAKYNEIPQYCGAEGSLWKITYPVAHHKFNSDRMVVIKNPSDLEKAK